MGGLNSLSQNAAQFRSSASDVASRSAESLQSHLGQFATASKEPRKGLRHLTALKNNWKEKASSMFSGSRSTSSSVRSSASSMSDKASSMGQRVSDSTYHATASARDGFRRMRGDSESTIASTNFSHGTGQMWNGISSGDKRQFDKGAYNAFNGAKQGFNSVFGSNGSIQKWYEGS